MADALFLVTRTVQGVGSDRNAVREVIIFQDDGDSDAVIIAQCITGLNAELGAEADAADVYPAGYFDTVRQIGATPVGPFDTEFDFIAYAPSIADVETP